MADALNHPFPWCKRRYIGFFRAFRLTIGRACIRPREFFQNMEFKSFKEGYLFFLMVFGIAMAGSAVVDVLWLKASKPLLWLIAVPLGIFVSTIGLFVIAGSMHAIARFIGGTGDFSETFTMACFASLPVLVTPLPYVGWIAACGGMVYLSIFGVQAVHAVGRKKAVGVVIMPIAIIAYTFFSFSASLMRASTKAIISNEAIAQRNCQSIYAACRAYYRKNGVYPVSLAGLLTLQQSPLSLAIIQADSPKKALNGYHYFYNATSNGGFTVYALPQKYGVTGEKRFFFDESGALKADRVDMHILMGYE